MWLHPADLCSVRCLAGGLLVVPRLLANPDKKSRGCRACLELLRFALARTLMQRVSTFQVCFLQAKCDSAPIASLEDAKLNGRFCAALRTTIPVARVAHTFQLAKTYFSVPSVHHRISGLGSGTAHSTRTAN